METVPPVRATPEDLHRVSEGPLPELIDGRFIPREPKGQRLDAFVLRIMFALGNYSESSLPGLINGTRCGFQIFPHDPNRVRVVDVAFTRRDRLSMGELTDGHARMAPDLIAEVITPKLTFAFLERKIEDFLGAGVPLMWIFSPESRIVHLYRGDGTGGRRRAGDVLDGGEILPGFSCPVAGLFG